MTATALIVAIAAAPAWAQVDCAVDPDDPACAAPDETTSTTTTDDGTDNPVSTTQVRQTTTTVRRTTTTEAPDDEVIFEEDVAEEPVTTLAERPSLLVPGPPLTETRVRPDAAQDGGPDEPGERVDVDPAASTGDADDTRRTVTLAIAGLLVAAILLGALTWWYWRHTKPSSPTRSGEEAPTDGMPPTPAATDDGEGPTDVPPPRPAAVDDAPPTGTDPGLAPEDADWHHDGTTRTPMAAPPGRVTDRAR